MDQSSQPPGKPLPSAIGKEIPYDRFLDCVHCGLCTSACPTYLETGDENDSPRGRIYLMRAVTDGRLEMDDSVARHLDLCLDCRSCETACPSGVQYGRLIEPFRVDMRREAKRVGRDQTRSWFHRVFLFGLFPDRRKMAAALAPARLLQRLGMSPRRFGRWLPGKLERLVDQLPDLQPQSPSLPEFLPAQGKRRARVGLFLGCVADAMFREVHWATARVLQANGCDVVIPRSQTCCGAIHYHNGAAEPAVDLARKNRTAFCAEDLDAVIVNVAGCGSMLKDYGHLAHEVDTGQGLDEQLSEMASLCRDVSEFLDDLGPTEPQHQVVLRATYHDACHLVHAQRIRQPPRRLLSLVRGLELLDLPESEVCCGAAGSYNLTEPEMADRLGKRKAEHIRETGAEAVIMGNAGCSLQIQAALRRLDHPLPVWHPMQILDQAYSGTPHQQTGAR